MAPDRASLAGAVFWMNLQSQYDISLVEATKGDAIGLELAGASAV